MARGRRGKGENFISSVQEMHCHFVFIFSTDVIVKEGCAATNVQGSVERRDDNMEGRKNTGFHSPVSRWLRDSHIAALPGDVATHFFFWSTDPKNVATRWTAVGCTGASGPRLQPVIMAGFYRRVFVVAE